MPSAQFDAPLDEVVGTKTANALKKSFGYLTLGDLLSHYPRRYAMRGELTAISQIPVNENVTVVAEVLDVRERPMRAKRGSILEVRITDGSSGGIMTLTFFNQAWRAKDLRPGMRGIFAGKTGIYRGTVQLAHPDYELFDAVDAENAADGDSGGDATTADKKSAAEKAAEKWATTPIPIYAATSTLASWQIAKAIAVALTAATPVLATNELDPLPDVYRTDRKLLTWADALRKIHQPESEVEAKKARKTLRYLEAFVLQTALLEQRAKAHSAAATARQAQPGGLLSRLDAQLPFELTADQQTVGNEISAELAADHPMNRLVQGEVGSGKTLVALRAMLQVAESGGQSVLLAPTEVLAAQHLRSIVNALGPDLSAELMPTLITGQLPAAQKRQALLWAASGQARIVVGTHALLSDNVSFYDLGLVVVDEQHRFGVEQRQALRVKSEKVPHVLVLTATPIPRTVAMTVFGDLDVSIIATLPAGRAGITSHVVALADHPNWMTRVWQRIDEEIEQGRQVFIVCPAIDAAGVVEDDPDALAEDSETISQELAQELSFDGEPTTQPERASVESVLAELAAHPLFANRRIAGLHGRMSSDEKDSVMRAFAAGELDLIVATTVIEVGVDVPNASTMVVMDSDRFGISQLHQLRGRVGRGGVPGLALFVTHAVTGTTARERVEAVASTTDGFELARVDLELRSEGNVLGARQSGGQSSLKLLRVARDGDVIVDARDVAGEILGQDPTLAEHPQLAAAVQRRLSAAERDYLEKN